MRRQELAGILLAICSTAALASKPTVRHSDFDNSTEVQIAPHGLDCGFRMDGLSVGASWSSAWGDRALLQVETENFFASMRGAALSLDGRIIELELDGTTDHDYFGTGPTAVPQSEANFRVDLATIRSILAARSAMLRVTTPKGYRECYIRKIDKPNGSKAFGALQRFLAQVDFVLPRP